MPAVVAEPRPKDHAVLLPTGYAARCDADASGGRTFSLGAHTSVTAAGALAWLRCRVRQVAEQLDAPALKLAEGWLTDCAEQTAALAALQAGRMYELDMRSDQVRYRFRAQVEYWPEVTLTGAP